MNIIISVLATLGFIVWLFLLVVCLAVVVVYSLNLMDTEESITTRFTKVFLAMVVMAILIGVPNGLGLLDTTQHTQQPQQQLEQHEK